MPARSDEGREGSRGQPYEVPPRTQHVGHWQSTGHSPGLPLDFVQRFAAFRSSQAQAEPRAPA